MFQWGWIFLLNAWRKDKALYFFFCLIQSREAQMNQSHFKMYSTTHNSCTYTLASSRSTNNRDCGWWRMLPFNALICLSHFSVFLQLAFRGTCWGILPQLKWDWKISGCSEATVGNNLTHSVSVWGYCCLRVLLLKALCNILWPPQTQTDWQINFCLQIFDCLFHESIY